MMNDLLKQLSEAKAKSSTKIKSKEFSKPWIKLAKINSDLPRDREFWEELQNTPQKYVILSEKEYMSLKDNIHTIVIRYVEDLDYQEPDIEDLE